jgi:hypothetical protein
MASVLVLMVGIGLYALPLGREAEPVAFETVDEHEAEAPAASAPAEAEPEQGSEPAPAWARHEVEARGATRELKDADEAARKPEPEQLARAAAAKRQPAASPKADMHVSGRGRSLGKSAPAPGDAYADALASRSATDKGGADDRIGLGELGRGAGSAPGASAPFAPPPPPASSAGAAAAPARSARAEEAEAKEGAAAPSGDVARQALDAGIAAARRGAYAEATSKLEPIVRQGPSALQPSARLWLARSLRGQGRCADALRYYGPLTRAASVAPEVLGEAADCYERVGDAATAAQLRARSQPR